MWIQRQKRAYISEIQLNDVSIADKVDWARDHLEKKVYVSNDSKSQWTGQGSRKDTSICQWAPDWDEVHIPIHIYLARSNRKRETFSHIGCTSNEKKLSLIN